MHSVPLVMAAGSLFHVMEEILAAFHLQTGMRFETRYGPSGKLREEIEAGARLDVFAPASAEHAARLFDLNRIGPPKIFAHNELCIVCRSELAVDEPTLLDWLASDAVRVATSTPVSDPMGDYAWQFFRNADAEYPGFYRVMDAKALKLSGASTPLPGTRSPYVAAFADDTTDTYVMYATNAAQVKNALPHLKIMRIPKRLNVRSAYAIAAARNSAPGQALVNFVMGEEGRAILESHGFFHPEN